MQHLCGGGDESRRYTRRQAVTFDVSHKKGPSIYQDKDCFEEMCIRSSTYSVQRLEVNTAVSNYRSNFESVMSHTHRSDSHLLLSYEYVQ
jgi:hypothetical protein